MKELDDFLKYLIRVGVLKESVLLESLSYKKKLVGKMLGKKV